MADAKRIRADDGQISFRIRTDLGDALHRYLKESSPHVSMKAAIETAIERFLAEQGYWPSGSSAQEPEPPATRHRGRSSRRSVARKSGGERTQVAEGQGAGARRERRSQH